ncbi:lipoprotein-releasing ABC transporter permease subunit [Alteromonadaceae bacterium BrNp21-10]|nr:lipoprotein-releasing ABC transporter permease subunit [Alteromonadaceae bacterium BrNp21-10]
MASLSWQLAWRFRQGRRQNGFISFISGSSMAGIALGCFALILILSVMNGFERALKDELLSILPHGELTAVSPQGIQDWPQLIRTFKEDSNISQVQAVIKLTGMLQQAKIMKAVEVTAVDSELFKQGSLYPKISVDAWQQFSADHHSILLGKGIVAELGLAVGDKVQLMLPQFSESNQLLAPKSQWLTVAGELSLGGEIDKLFALMHISYAADIVNVEEGAQGLQFHFVDAFMAPTEIRKIGYNMTQHVYMSDWTRTQGSLYQDILLVKTVVYVVLTLVIGVACFNIVSAQMMAVTEKQSEIAMLKTMGAEDRLIIKTFVYQGAVNGIIGTLLGALAGIVVSLNLSTIAKALEHLTGVQFLSGDIYFIDFLPSELHWNDVAVTLTIALGLTLLATLFPAIKAAKVNPANVLGH